MESPLHDRFQQGWDFCDENMDLETSVLQYA